MKVVIARFQEHAVLGPERRPVAAQPVLFDAMHVELCREQRVLVLGPELGRAITGQPAQRDRQHAGILVNRPEQRTGHGELFDRRMLAREDGALDVVQQRVTRPLVHRTDDLAVG